MKRLVPLALASTLFAGCSHGNAVLPPGAPAPSLADDRSALAPFAQGVPHERLGAVRFTVALPLRNVDELNRFIAAASDPNSPAYARFLTHDQFLARYAPAAADLAVVARSLRDAGFNVTVADQAVDAGGSRAQVERYFATRLIPQADGAFVRALPLALPRALAQRGVSVVGFDSLHFRVDSQIVPLPAGMARGPKNFRSATGPYYTSDLKEAYRFPNFLQLAGADVKIGIVIDSPVMQTDVDQYFGAQGMTFAARLENVSVSGGASYDPTSSGTQEATLDVEQALGMAPRAQAIVYNIPSLGSTDTYDGYSAVVGDPSVKVVNSSWGTCESDNDVAVYRPFEHLFTEGIAEGQTFVAASGDFADSMCGSNGAGNPNVRGVQWPASSTQVLAVGGTNLTTQYVRGARDSSYVSEQAYQDNLGGGAHWGSGGGYSTPGYFHRQSWQVGFDTRPERGVPDVALHMGGCPNGVVGRCSASDSSDVLVMNGRLSSVIGTSAAAPDIAGLIALTIEGKHQPQGMGDIHVLLYLDATAGNWRRGIAGNNGFPTTGGSWDPVLGIGTPIDAYKIAGATQPAGVPGTPGNP